MLANKKILFLLNSVSQTKYIYPVNSAYDCQFVTWTFFFSFDVQMQEEGGRDGGRQGSSVSFTQTVDAYSS